MSGAEVDYPLVRASDVCPVCGGVKGVGLVVCWDCYRSYHLRDGMNALVLSAIEARERKLGKVSPWMGRIADRLQDMEVTNMTNEMTFQGKTKAQWDEVAKQKEWNYSKEHSLDEDASHPNAYRVDGDGSATYHDSMHDALKEAGRRGAGATQVVIRKIGEDGFSLLRLASRQHGVS